MGKTKKEYKRTGYENDMTFFHYYTHLQELCLSRYEWLGLPDTIDERFLERTLMLEGRCLFFKDDVLGFLALSVAPSGKWNVYDIPTERRAIASNGYQASRTESDSVIIYNNTARTNNIADIVMYARRLAEYERTIDININAQKTPILITCNEDEKVALEIAYKQYNGNMPVIKSLKDIKSKGNFSVLTTGAPYVAGNIYDLKVNLWNEALTYLGITNLAVNKKERLITDEVQRLQGGTLASRNSGLLMRKQACEQIKRMYPELADLDVRYRDTDISVDDSEQNVFVEERINV